MLNGSVKPQAQEDSDFRRNLYRDRLHNREDMETIVLFVPQHLRGCSGYGYCHESGVANDDR